MNPPKEILLTREQLYEKVWSTPAIKLAKEFGISDVAIAKICKKHNIPKPYPGYWQEVAAKKHIRLVPLPKITPDISDEIIIHPTIRQSAKRVMSPELNQKIDFESQPQNYIYVEGKPRNLHPLVSDAKKYLSNDKPDSFGRLTTPRMLHCLDIHVSKSNINRALCIVNALLYALESRGYTVDTNTERCFRTVINIGEEKVRSRIIEKIDRTDNPNYDKSSFSNRWNYTPNGLLQLEIADQIYGGCQRKWSDLTGNPLENQLNNVMKGILMYTDDQHRRTLAWEEERLKKDEERQAREVMENQKKEEKERLKQLESESEKWIKSQNLLTFIKACEAKFIKRSGSIHPDSPEAKWLQWAKAYLDSIDPLKSDFLEKSIERLK